MLGTLDWHVKEKVKRNSRTGTAPHTVPMETKLCNPVSNSPGATIRALTIILFLMIMLLPRLLEGR
jgi:hypothetical protein